MTQHAKAPWSVHDLQFFRPAIEISDAEGFAIVRVPWSKTQKENINLIVAAPDLLDACKQALTLFEDDEGIARVLDAAIRKATEGTKP